jgi:hypothetical protein
MAQGCKMGGKDLLIPDSLVKSLPTPFSLRHAEETPLHEHEHKASQPRQLSSAQP